MKTNNYCYLFLILILSATLHSIAEAEVGKVTNYETKGNLESTQTVECEGFSKLNNKFTPADLYEGVKRCIRADNFDTGAEMFALAGTYATFDKLRVADKTSHQAHTVLTIEALDGLSDSGKRKFMEAMQSKLTKDTPQLKESCRSVRAIGRPDYFPKYMIMHGMGAFSGDQADAGLVSSFNPEKAWEAALDQYLHCPK